MTAQLELHTQISERQALPESFAWKESLWPIQKDILNILPDPLLRHLVESGNLSTVEYPWQLMDAMLGILDSDAFMQYVEMMKEMNPEISYTIDPSARIIHPEAVYIGQGATIGADAKIYGPAFIGDGAIIGTPIGNYGDFVSEGTIGKAIIGAHTKVKQRMYVNDVITGERCALNEEELKDTIMGNGSSMHGGRINDSLIGHHVSMSTAKTANYANGKDVYTMIDGNPVNTGRKRLGAIIGNDSVLRMDVITMPGVMIGQGCTIDNQAKVDRNIPDRHFLQVVSTQQLFEKPKK